MASEPPRPDLHLPRTRRAALIQRLAQPPRLEVLTPAAAALVRSVRLVALLARRGQDPLAELTCRLGSVTAAKALLGFLDCAGRGWPENVRVFMPCCGMLSPDEALLAGLIDTAGRGDRSGFDRQLDGFIRADRHDRLFASAVEAAVLLR